jgi:hypothetical protein
MHSWKNNSLFEIDRELDLLLDEIQEEAEDGEEVRPELLERFQEFCDARSEKVDRIGRFLSIMESRSLYCRAQAARLSERARLAENKVKRTENIVALLPQEQGPPKTRCIRQMKPSNGAIKSAAGSYEEVPGAEVRRGFHLRVA